MLQNGIHATIAVSAFNILLFGAFIAKLAVWNAMAILKQGVLHLGCYAGLLNHTLILILLDTVLRVERISLHARQVRAIVDVKIAVVVVVHQGSTA